MNQIPSLAHLRTAVTPTGSDDAHPFYQAQANECELFELAYRQQLPLLLKGPTGCGKTRFINYMAARLQRPLITVACHDDLTAADLVGRHLIGQGETLWSDGPLSRAVRQGAICYLDEIVEARKDTTVVLHPLSDDRRILPIERTGEELVAPPEFMLVVSYNPGYQHILKSLKPSTRQRFIAIQFNYPQPEIELAIVHKESGVAIEIAERLVHIAQQFRRLQHHDLEEAASTRLLVYAAQLIVAGCDPWAACRAALIEPLSDDAQTITALQEVVSLHFARR